MSFVSVVRAAKERGNASFQKQQWDAAIGCYRQAVRPLNSTGFLMPSAEEDRAAAALELTATFSNLSQCFLKKKDYREALFAADKAVEQLAACAKGPKSLRLGSKVWQRKATALEALGEAKEAEEAQKKSGELLSH